MLRLRKAAPTTEFAYAHEYLIAADDFSHNFFIYGARVLSIDYDKVVKNMKSFYAEKESTTKISATVPSTTEKHTGLQ